MSASKSSLGALTLGAVGVVYGDIGTSVLYAVKEVFGTGHVPFTHDNVYGVLSIIFWTLTVIVSLKYVTLVLRADNHGEGGLVAMLALASQSVKHKAPALRKWMLLIGIFGTCLFYGDGVITPAITVLSAVEGLDVVSPAFRKAVIPLTLAILFFYFPAFIVPLTPWLSGFLPASGYLALQAQGAMLALGIVLSVALLSGGLFPSRNAHATSVQRAVIHAGWLGASLAPFLLAGMFLWGWDTWRTIWLPAGAITVLAGISAWRLAGPWKRRRWVGWYPVMVFGGVLALSALVMSGMAAWRFAAMLLG